MYDILLHALLSLDAKAKGPDEIQAQQRVAERVLGLRDTDYLGSAKADAEDALAMQVSLQVATDPETYLAQSETRGSRSITYRDQVPLHPLALTIAEALFSEDLGAGNRWPTITSLR
jgi:hypothetical protein